MSTIVPLPNGGTATLRDALVSERQHRVLESAFTAASSAMTKLASSGIDPDQSQEEQMERASAVPLSRDEAEALLAVQDAAIVAFVERWSLKQPLPTMDDVEDLPRETYRALADATMVLARTAMNTPPTDFTTAGKGIDQALPTGASGSFDGLSGAVPLSVSIAPQPTSTASSASAS